MMHKAGGYQIVMHMRKGYKAISCRIVSTKIARSSDLGV